MTPISRSEDQYRQVQRLMWHMSPEHPTVCTSKHFVEKSDSFACVSPPCLASTPMWNFFHFKVSEGFHTAMTPNTMVITSWPSCSCAQQGTDLQFVRAFLSNLLSIAQLCPYACALARELRVRLAQLHKSLLVHPTHASRCSCKCLRHKEGETLPPWVSDINDAGTYATQRQLRATF